MYKLVLDFVATAINHVSCLLSLTKDILIIQGTPGFLNLLYYEQ